LQKVAIFSKKTRDILPNFRRKYFQNHNIGPSVLAQPLFELITNVKSSKMSTQRNLENRKNVFSSRIGDIGKKISFESDLV
jgi:hypothetical protein